MATDPLAAARARLRDAATIVPHTDADGLAAGAIALWAKQATPDKAVLLGRGQTPFGPDAPIPPGAVAVLDWGVRQLCRPGLIVDHHAPEVEPTKDQILVSGYKDGPPVSTAVLMKRIVPDAPGWLAAVGGFGDYGEAALKLPECLDIPKGSKSALKKLVPLINAPRRLPGTDAIRTALQLLLDHADPRDVLKDERIEVLEAAKAEYRAGFDAAVRTAPKVGPTVAVLRFTSPYQVHPLVATTWARRLAPKVVMAANDGYLPGRVNFAVRCDADGPVDLRKLLRDALPDAVGGEFANGHDRATGGSLTPGEFAELLRKLNVPE